MCSFPKVLIISVDPFNKNNGTGITLSNLFDGWDKSNIAQVYMSDISPDTSICTNFYKLSSKIAPFDYFIRNILFKKNKKTAISGTPAAVTLGKEQKSIKKSLHLNMRAIADFSPIFLPLELFKWIDTFKPDIIYSAAGSVRMMNLVNKISKSIDKPIVPHFMDDWPATSYTQKELLGCARILFNRKFDKLIANSNGGLCISEQMAVEYKKRYKKSFSPFVNCVDDKFFFKPTINVKLEDEFVIMYIGGLHLNRWESLLDFAKVIEELNILEGKISLKIHCPCNDKQVYEKYFKEFSATKFEGSLKSDQVSIALNKATLLVHIESFEENLIKFIKFSLSTKIPQYMAAGKAIVGYGPSILASMQHIVKANAGIVVAENNSNALKEELTALIHNKEALANFATSGFLYATKYHTKSYNLDLLKNTLTNFSAI